MNTQNNEIRQVVVPARDALGAVFGWLALIAGIGAIVLWGIVFVPLALLFAGLALWRKNWVWGSVGGVLGLIGIVLSPTLWALFAGLTLMTAVSEKSEEPKKPTRIEKTEKLKNIEAVKVPPPAPAPVAKPVQKEIVPTIKMEVFGKDDQLGFEVAKVTVNLDAWCKQTTDIALIVKRNGFIANSLGILETASQLASFECEQAGQFDVNVLERPVEGDLKTLAEKSYFSAQMKRQPDGRWVSQ